MEWGGSSDRRGGKKEDQVMNQPSHPPFQMLSGLRSWQPASLWPLLFCSCLQWPLGVAVTVPWNLLLTGHITRSSGCEIEEVKSTLTLLTLEKTGTHEKKVGRRTGTEPGVRDALRPWSGRGDHFASHYTIHSFIPIILHGDGIEVIQTASKDTLFRFEPQCCPF